MDPQLARLMMSTTSTSSSTAPLPLPVVVFIVIVAIVLRRRIGDNDAAIVAFSSVLARAVLTKKRKKNKAE
jgi:hypothetical protein